MSEFGDHDPDDSFDPTAPLDLEQVARKLLALEGGQWDELTESQRDTRIRVIRRLIAWLRRSGHLR